jgi:tRNA pseudouridine38-40 synthase
MTELEELGASTPRLQRIMLEVAYDGRPYAGFVRQTNAHTVAAELESAISHLDPQATRLTCASRTDSGVHARHQIVSFQSGRAIPARGWALGLRPLLPESITILGAALVPPEFDPRLDPLWKRYRYRVFVSRVPDPFEAGRAHWILGPLNSELMQEAARCLVGEHDFNAFRSARDQRTSTVRRIDGITVERQDPGAPRVDIVVTGNRFLHNMVRIIAGTLVDIGQGRRDPECFARALSTGRREDLGMTAPANGLYLEHVELATQIVDRFPPAPV